MVCCHLFIYPSPQLFVGVVIWAKVGRLSSQLNRVGGTCRTGEVAVDNIASYGQTDKQAVQAVVHSMLTSYMAAGIPNLLSKLEARLLAYLPRMPVTGAANAFLSRMSVFNLQRIQSHVCWACLLGHWTSTDSSAADGSVSHGPTSSIGL
jgi:hypothetical protein